MPENEPIVAPSPAITPGVKTSEFWLTVLVALASLGTQIGGILPPPWGLVIAGASTSIYAVLRTYLKKPGANGANTTN